MRARRAWAGAAALVAALAGTASSVAASSAAAPRVSLERVTLTQPTLQIPQLDALGVDVTEQVTARSAVVVAASDGQRTALRATGLPVRTLIADYGGRSRAARRADLRAATVRSALPSGRTTYRTPAEIQADLDGLVAGHPGLVRRVELPQRSVEGRPITGVEIATDVNRDDDGRPVYVVVGAHHAREWPSAEIPVEFALDLVQNQTDPRIAKLLGALRIVIIPVENPDAFAYSRGTSPSGQLDPVAGIRRRNCRAVAGDRTSGSCAAHRGVDLNRNYGAYWGGLGASTSPDEETYRGSGPWSEPEAAAFHELTQRLPVTGVQSLHNIAGLVLRPPGFRALGLAPDEAKLKALGDAMGRATGYASQYGYQLYEVTGATEDWNYVAQGAFAYTIETAGAGPGDADFHGPYGTHVVDQYRGGGASAGPAGQGVREALLLAAEEAADPDDHVVLRGHAPAGARLTLRKSFDTATSPRCTDTLSGDACGPTLAPLQSPDFTETTLTVGTGGVFLWHQGPSTRPFVRAAGHRETWSLTCVPPAGAGAGTGATKAVFADRGQVVDVDPCDAASVPRTGKASQSTAVTRASISGPLQTLRAVRSARKLRLRVTCPLACTAGLSARDRGAVVGTRSRVALRAHRASVVSVPLTASGRRRLGSGGAPRTLRVTLTVRTRAANTAALTRSVTLG